MASKDLTTGLQREATCSICMELYTDPVTIDCGHNFCLCCLTKYIGKPALEISCPECKQKFYHKNLNPNKRLANIAEIAQQMNKSQHNLCEEHEEKLQLFCENDGKLICLVCRESTAHKSHCVQPIKEAEQEYKGKLLHWLHPLRKEMEGILAEKQKEDKKSKYMRNRLGAERQKLAADFERLHQLLKKEEHTLLRRLDEMDKNITVAENENIARLSDDISSLNALITEIEEKFKQPAEELLKDVKSTLSRCEHVKFPNPEEITKKCKVQVTLDPDTASRWLILSEDGRRVRWGDTEQTLPDNPKRFTVYSCVLGREGFSSGRHYWQVELLQEGQGWCIGAARESLSRKELVTLSPERGVWAVWGFNGQYEALVFPPSRLSPRENPRKLGVYLDYEERKLSLYNADTMEHLHTFTSSAFTRRVFPFFRLWIGAELHFV